MDEGLRPNVGEVWNLADVSISETVFHRTMGCALTSARFGTSPTFRSLSY
jgi:hypothetical protein